MSSSTTAKTVNRMQVDPNTVNKPLPGYGVLKELKSQHNFQKLEQELDADSTPSLGANEVRKNQQQERKKREISRFFFPGSQSRALVHGSG
jgi:hypothetical protein